LDTARCEKVANAVEARLSIDMEPIISGGIKGAKCFASLRCTLLKVFVEHLFPARRVDAGGIRDHSVEIEQNSVVLVACDCPIGLGLLRWCLSISFVHTVVLPGSTCLSIVAG
jgi:hypothetical protein